MWVWIGLIMVGLLVVAVALCGALVVSLRTGYQPALMAIRRMNRRFSNPRVMRTAGTPGASASVIHHVGRSTGTPYQTPIGVLETEDGFVITLPYGENTDWLKNVEAAGSAVLETDGRSCRVEDPQVVRRADVEHNFSGKDRLVHRIFGVDQFLVLMRVGSDVPVGDDQ